MAAKNQECERIQSLDGLRAVSIVLVLFGHLSETAGFLSLDVYKRVGDVANLGVRVFFVISGYLITSLLLKELKTTGGISLLHFYFRRALRILPAAYFFMLCAVVLATLGICSLTKQDLLLASTYLINFWDGRSWDFGHLWSLAVEEQFYLLWPATIALLGRQRAMRRAAWLVGLVPIGRALWGVFKPYRSILIFFASPNADALLVGCLLAGWGDAIRNWRLYSEFLRSRWFYLVPVAIVLLNADPTYWRFLVSLSLINVGIAMCIDRWAHFPPDAVARFLNLSAVRKLGVMSYALYLWQQIFLNRNEHAFWTAFPLNLTLAIACAWITHEAIEKPFLRLRHNLEQKWRRRHSEDRGQATATGVVLDATSGADGRYALPNLPIGLDQQKRETALPNS